MIIGIDCGKTGGVALLDMRGHLVDGFRMPTLRHGKRELVNTREISRRLEPLDANTEIVIEQVGAMPNQGVTSMFNFGRHTGAVEGWSIVHGVPVHWVTPQKWKKSFGLSSDKRASLDRARLEFGDNSRWDVLANDGIAEAALIALWYLRSK